jgi:hypothetical protein
MNDQLLSLQLKEEWRMLTSYFSSQTMFILFPFILVVVGFSMSWLLPFVREAFNMQEVLTALILLTTFYGLFVGGFGFFADQVAETWFRDATLLLHVHHILPISFKRIFVWFYIKDIVYYLFMTLIPFFVGAFLSFQLPMLPFFYVIISAVCAFLMGVSVSFLLSALYVRNGLSLLGILVIAGGIIYARIPLRSFPPLRGLLEKDMISFFISIGIFILFSLLALLITQPVLKSPRNRVSHSSLLSRMHPLLAKEIIDVQRSGTWRIIVTSYVFPLGFLYGIFYFSGRIFSVSLHIPLLFYATFIGYLSTLVYSWLNNIDTPQTLSTLPVTPFDLIKRKIQLFLLSSFLIATIYLLLCGYGIGELSTLPLALFTMGGVTVYVVGITAWLCGLYPNTRLFDGSVLLQYLAYILPVLVGLSILSLTQMHGEIFIVTAVLLLISFFVYRGLHRRYGNHGL